MPVGTTDSSLLHNVKIISVAHLAAYSMGSVSAILRGNAAGVG
jgi:hypothetical protein